MELTRYARESGLSPRTLRRRLRELHDRHGGILRSYAQPGQRVGKWWFHPLALQAAMVATTTEDRLDDHDRRLEELENKAVALRDAFKSVRAMVKRSKSPKAA